MISAFLITDGREHRLAVRVRVVALENLLHGHVLVLVRSALPLPPEIQESAVVALVRMLRAELHLALEHYGRTGGRG